MATGGGSALARKLGAGGGVVGMTTGAAVLGGGVLKSKYIPIPSARRLRAPVLSQRYLAVVRIYVS
ncbi:MAG: hypothetical protein OXH84_07915 [Gammaproteobacteria bacterium]|nr:hypothetical protein [Gammaproteobacteria bacterium]